MRRLAIASALCALLLTACCTGGSNESTPTRTTDTPPPTFVRTGCADLVVLGLRGSDQSLDHNFGSGQEILRSVSAMADELHRKSRTTVRLEGIPYRAENAASYAIYQANITDGVTRTQSRIAALAKRCPASKVALVGFSQGAQAVHGVAVELSAASKQVVLVAMIADPRRNPADTIASWTYGKTAPGPGKLGAGTPLGARLKDRAISFCATGDEICNWPPGGYDGPLSATHRHFYEKPAHARSTGRQLARILRAQGL